MSVQDIDEVQVAATKALGTQLTPKRVKELIAADEAVPGGSAMYRVGTSHRGDLTISVSLRDKDSKYVASIVRSYRQHKGKRIVHHELLTVEPMYQGTKVGSEIFRGQIRQYLASGVDVVETEAAWVGQYYWPSVGFKLRNPAALKGYQKEFETFLRGMWIDAETAKRVAYDSKTIHELAMSDINGEKAGKQFLLERGKEGALIELELDLSDGSLDRSLLQKRIGL